MCQKANVASSKVSNVLNKSSAGPILVQFRLEYNNKSKSVSKGVVQFLANYSIKICIKSENIVSSPLFFQEKWRDLTWFCIGPKFKLHNLRKITLGFTMVVLSPNRILQSFLRYRQT